MTTNQTKHTTGYYLTAVAALLSIVAAIVYRIYFMGVDYTHGSLFNNNIFLGLLIAGIVAFIMLMVKLESFAPVVLCVASGFSTLAFLHVMLWPITDIVVAIDPVPFAPNLYLCIGLLVACFILSEITLYMRKSKNVTSN